MDREPKRLYRSTTNRIIGGVCGGLGEYFNLDPTVLRVIFAFFVLAGGAGIVAYIALWIIMPEAGASSSDLGQQASRAAHEMKDAASRAVSSDASGPGRASLLVGGLLVVAGVFALGNQLLPWRIFRWDMFWPFAVVAIGVTIMIRKR